MDGSDPAYWTGWQGGKATDGTGAAPADEISGLSLRTRLLVYLALVLVIPAGYTAFEAWREYRERHATAVAAIRDEAAELAGGAFNWIDSTAEMLALLATKRAVLDRDAAACGDLARDLVLTNPRYASIAVADPDGRLFCLSDDITGAGRDMSDRHWFRYARDNRLLSPPQFIFGKNTRLPLIGFGYPAAEDGRLQAVVFAGLDPYWLSRRLQRHNPFDNRIAYVFDADGRILAGQGLGDELTLGQALPDQRLLQTARDLGGTDQDAILEARDAAGRPRLFAVRPYGGAGGGLYAAVGVPAGQPQAAAMRHAGGNLVADLLALLVAWAIAWFTITRSVSRPVAGMVGTLRRLKRGDETARVGPGYARGELGYLGRTVDEMADSLIESTREVRRSEAFSRAVLDNLIEGLLVYEETGTIIRVNPALERLLGHPGSALIGRAVDDLVALPDRTGGNPFLAPLPSPNARDGEPRLIRVVTRDGHPLPVEINLASVQVGERRVRLAVVHDIRRRMEAENQLRDQNRELLEAQRIGRLGSWLWKVDEDRVELSEAHCRILGIEPNGGLAGLEAFVAHFHPDDRDRLREALRAAAAGEAVTHGEFRVVTPAGAERVVVSHWEVETDSNGRVRLVRGIDHDVTDQHATEQQLRQAVKMEAIGQLTGGIAHDFNNMLGVVIGNLDLLKETVEDDPEATELVDGALDASLRGAELNKRLLAVSRRQSLRPEVVEPVKLVGEMEKLLRKSVGEKVAVSVEAEDGVWPIEVDISQLEAAILNLAVNARDAMAGGGQLSIKVRNAFLDDEYAASHVEVTPGEYVLISVEDTGTGIPPEVLSRIFDPFFSTKEVGKGTGLGLSMVHGFIKQSGGHIKAYSEAGHGTVFRIYLPRAAEAGEQARAPGLSEAERIGAGETVLVVDDDESLRRTALRNLDSLGYRTLEAADAAAALRLLEGDQGADVDLLFTDVVMPGMDGPELAEQALARRPGVKVLLTSGFTRRPAAQHDGESLPWPLLEKPYRKPELAEAVRRILDDA